MCNLFENISSNAKRYFYNYKLPVDTSKSILVPSPGKLNIFFKYFVRYQNETAGDKLNCEIRSENDWSYATLILTFRLDGKVTPRS